MRPITHPAIEDVSVEAILHALADPVRIAIYAEIISQQCTQNCSTFLRVGDRPIPKSTLSQHFRILREAGLIYSERRGVEMHNTSRCAEVDAQYPRLLATIVEAYQVQTDVEARKRRTAARKSRITPSRRSAAR